MKGHLTRGRVEGTWYLRVELPRDADGARRQQRETFRGTKAEAERRLREFLREAEQGGIADAQAVLADVFDHWAASAEHRVGTRTLERYKTIVRLYLKPALGSLKASALRPAHVEAALRTWVASGRLTPRGVRHCFDTLRAACRWASRMGIILRDPTSAVRPPRVERREMKALDQEGAAKLLRAGWRGRTCSCRSCLLSVRASGALEMSSGLRWNDFNLQSARLSVRRSLESVNGVIRSKSPKTARSASDDLGPLVRRERPVASPRGPKRAMRAARTSLLQRRMDLPRA